MEFWITILTMIAIITATGLIWTVTQSQSVDAWHSQGRASKQDCVNYIMQVTGNNATEAEFKCEKVIPHYPFTSDLNVSNKSS
jgi:hypothetical protein